MYFCSDCLFMDGPTEAVVLNGSHAPCSVAVAAEGAGARHLQRHRCPGGFGAVGGGVWDTFQLTLCLAPCANSYPKYVHFFVLFSCFFSCFYLDAVVSRGTVFVPLIPSKTTVFLCYYSYFVLVDVYCCFTGD